MQRTIGGAPAGRSPAEPDPGGWRDFRWPQVRSELAGLPEDTGLNLGYEAVDRHVVDGRGAAVAVRGPDRIRMTYAQLASRTNRFASAVRRRGAVKGDRVATLLPAGPELVVAAVGTLKNTCVFTPLVPGGRGAAAARLLRSQAKILVTTPELYRTEIAPVRAHLTGLRAVLVTGDGPAPAGTEPLDGALSAAEDDFRVPPTNLWDMALLHFTAGTTGPPKPVVHVHEAVLAYRMTARYALDLRPGDTVWCPTDPGWATGTAYGVLAPLLVGATVLAVPAAGRCDAGDVYATLAGERVTVWCTEPTVLQALQRAGGTPAGTDLSALRVVASLGGPLGADVVAWTSTAFGQPARDMWAQTETGAVVIGNGPGAPVRPGSMGRPVPGLTVALLARGPDGRAAVVDGRVRVLEGPGAVGEIALRPGWPSMFRGYLHDRGGYARCFVDGWYLTGDLARRDADGYYWFVGRAGEVIRAAGRLVGPDEVEHTLMEHPAVAEAGVIGKPDPVAGAVLKAYICLRPGVSESDDLRSDLLDFGRRRLGPVAPREIAFARQLPHTATGTLLRRALRARDLGLAEPDPSTVDATRRA